MCPLYGANSHSRHYVEHHPAKAVPVLPELVPSTAALIRADRRERSASRTNNNTNANAVNAVDPNAATTQPAQFTPPTPVAVADTTTLASVTTRVSAHFFFHHIFTTFSPHFHHIFTTFSPLTLTFPPLFSPFFQHFFTPFCLRITLINIFSPLFFCFILRKNDYNCCNSNKDRCAA